MTVPDSVPFRPLPGPRGLPLLGNLPAFGKDPLAFFTGLRDQYGDVVVWSLGRRRALFLAHPEHIAELLGAVERTYEPGDVGWAFKTVSGDSVVRSRGALWRRKRALLQPAVRPRQVRGYAATMVDCARIHADRWRAGGRIDVQHEMSQVTQRIVARTLFGDDLGAQADAIGEALAVIEYEMGAEVRSMRLFLPPWVRTPARRRLLAELATVDREVSRLIRARQAAMSHGDTAEEREDLLSRLLAARDEHGRPLTAKEVRDEAVTLWLAGHETTTMALTWTWYLLSAHPVVRSRLTDELDRVLEGRPPVYEDYERLPWTRQIVKEVLRLYPPAWVIPLRAKAGATLGGQRVPAGDAVWCSQWVTQRDARWFPDPAAFRPERWEESGTGSGPGQTWFPFGAGPRTCMGARFALVEAVLVLATLAQRFHVAVDPGRVEPQAVQLLLPATPMRATLHAVGTPDTVRTSS